MKKNVILDIAIGILIITILLYVNIPYLKIVMAGTLVLMYTGLTGGLKDRLGFSRPKSWIKALFISFCIAILMVVTTYFLLLPMITKLTGDALLIGPFQQIKGNTNILFSSIAIGWIIGGFFEEVIFRGFLLGTILDIKNNTLVKIGGVIFTSVLFGYLHSYQGITGQILISIIGASLGFIFIINNRSIWINIVTHGLVNTVTMVCIYFGVFEV